METIEKLSKKEIDNLHTSGKRLNFSSFYTLWNFNKKLKAPPIRIVISIPKKKIKKAVDRNYIKRRVKSAYKLHENEFVKKIVYPINIIIVYNKTLLIEYDQLQEELVTLFKKIIEEANENY